MKWLKYLAILVVVFFAAGIVFYFSIHYVVEDAIVDSATKATGVSASLDDLRIAFLGGEFQMNQFVLSNPKSPEFDSEHFLSLDNMKATLELRSLLEDVIEIPMVHLDGLQINLERKKGQENYRVIQSNIAAPQQANQKSADDPQAYVIRELVISNIKVRFRGYPAMNRTLELADIRLTDVGAEDQPVRRSEITGIIVREVYRQLLQNPDLIPGAALEGIRQGMKQLSGFMDISVQFLGDVKDDAGNVLGTVGDSAGDAADNVGEFLKGVFGGND